MSDPNAPKRSHTSDNDSHSYTYKVVEAIITNGMHDLLSQFLEEHSCDIPQDLTVESFIRRLEDIRKKNETYPPDSHKESGIECIRCNKRYVVSREVQTRSADEGSTIFYICINCGHKWA